MRARYAVKEYLLRLANRYAKQGFYVAAAGIYSMYDPPAAREIHLKLARRAEKKGFHLLAAQLYEAASAIRASRAMYQRAFRQFERDDVESLAKEVSMKLQGREKVDAKAAAYVSAALRLERIGRFREAKRYWARAAGRRARAGDLEAAAKFYSNACEIPKAENLWHRRASSKS